MSFSLPEDIGSMINEYAKPIGRLDWREKPSPSCLAIQSSDEFRDYRTAVVCGGKMGMENVTPATSWDDWCYWNAVITRPRYVSINDMVRTGINPDYYNSDPAWHSTSSENWQLLESSDETWVSSAKDEYDMIQIAEEYFMNLEN